MQRPQGQQSPESGSQPQAGTSQSEQLGGPSGAAASGGSEPPARRLSASEQLSADLAAVESALSQQRAGGRGIGGGAGGGANGSGNLQAAVTSALAAAGSTSNSGSLSGSGSLLAAAASVTSVGSGGRLSGGLPSIDEQTARLAGAGLAEQYAGQAQQQEQQRRHSQQLASQGSTGSQIQAQQGGNQSAQQGGQQGEITSSGPAHAFQQQLHSQQQQQQQHRQQQQQQHHQHSQAQGQGQHSQVQQFQPPPAPQHPQQPPLYPLTAQPLPPSTPQQQQQQQAYPLGPPQQPPPQPASPPSPYLAAQQHHYQRAQLMAAAAARPLPPQHQQPGLGTGLGSFPGNNGANDLPYAQLQAPAAVQAVPHMDASPPPGLPGAGPPDSAAPFSDQLRYRDAQITKLAGTLAHYRAWSTQVQARYQMFNAEVARPARRIYVGGLPSGTQELELRQYVNDLLMKSGGSTAPGFPINSCKLYPEKNFAFLEFRSVEEASNCMAFDGIAFRECYLKIRRPNNYEADVCIMLGPPEPDPTMDLTALDIVKTVVMDSPNKLFVGGLPCDWTEDQVKELLLPFGMLKAFNLVMDKTTGNSKGYCFCEFADTALTNYVIQALNGKPVGTKFLTVKRALAPSAPSFDQPSPPPQGAQGPPQYSA